MHRDPLVERMRGYGTTIFAEMTALAAAHEAVNLGQGFPDSDGPDAMLEVAANALRDGGLNQYPPGPGRPELRRAIAGRRREEHGMVLDPDTEIHVTVGATEGVAASVLSLCEAGDEVIVIEPYYDSYAATISLAGARRVAVPLRPDGGSKHSGSTHGGSRRFALDVDALRAAVSRRTRAVIVNSPHNPTGSVLTGEELAAVAEICCDHDLVAIVDEVYEHLVYDGVHTPLATLPGMRERTLSVSSAGKTFSVTGWKIGWVSGPAALIRGVATVKQFLTFTHSAPMQLAVAYGLDHEQPWIEAQCRSMAARRDRLTAGLGDCGLAVHRPQAGYFVLADIRPLVGDDADGDAWARALPGVAGVAAIPVAPFCDDRQLGRPLVRFAFCKQIDVLDEAIQRLRSADLGRMAAVGGRP